jgi:hypothetical protein
VITFVASAVLVFQQERADFGGELEFVDADYLAGSTSLQKFDSTQLDDDDDDDYDDDDDRHDSSSGRRRYATRSTKMRDDGTVIASFSPRRRSKSYNKYLI